MISLKRRDLLSLFSIFLVTSCVTVPRIQRKDARNNQFSTQLQNWIYLAHPPKIDTGVQKISSDTSVYESDSTYYVTDSVVYGIEPHDTIAYNDPGIFQLNTNSYHQNPPKIITKVIEKIITRTIHDTIMINMLDVSEANALKNDLQAARDSTNNFQKLYSNEKLTALHRLIWIVGLGLALGLSGYLYIKKI